MRRFNQFNKPIPPRQFPKQQYRKLIWRFWAVIIGIIIIIIAGISVIITGSRTQRPAPHHPARSVKVDRHPKRIHQQSHRVKINPKTGEKLLGHWLIKLHYPNVKNRAILNSYQRKTPQQDVQISQQLVQLIQNKTSTINRQDRIHRFIDHQFK